MEKKSEKVSAVLGHITFGVWVLFGVSWIMSYFPSLADEFPSSHFWWILLAGIVVHSFYFGYEQPSFTKTVWLDKDSEEEGVHGKYKDENGNWVDSESKYKEIPVSQKVLVVSGLKNMFVVAGSISVIVAGLAIWGNTIGWGDEGCIEYYAGYDTGWSDVCVAYEDDYYEEEEPYAGYNDSYDQDCSDIGYEVYVGSYDPDGLDADSDGYGCESYGG
jgi:hypothetical protein